MKTVVVGVIVDVEDIWKTVEIQGCECDSDKTMGNFCPVCGADIREKNEVEKFEPWVLDMIDTDTGASKFSIDHENIEKPIFEGMQFILDKHNEWYIFGQRVIVESPDEPDKQFTDSEALIETFDFVKNKLVKFRGEKAEKWSIFLYMLEEESPVFHYQEEYNE